MRKRNYLSNHDLLEEIHKSKSTFCSFLGEDAHQFDIILPSLDRLNIRTVAQAKRNHADRITKKAYKEAHESGDSDALVLAQESLTNVKIKTDKLNNFKIPPLQGEQTPVQPGVASQPTPEPVADARAVEWAKKNTWFGSDDEMTSLALGLHNKLAKQGIDLQSDEYYEAIDTRMRQVFPDNFEEIAEPEAEKPKRQANVVAPATRSTAPKKVRLSQTQIALAKRLGLTPEQYAKQVALDMRKENG